MRALLLALALVTAACGDTATTTTTAATESPPPEPQALAASAGVTRAAPDPAAPVRELAAGLNEAGFDLWRAQPADGNLVFSAASIGHALLMARPTADEPTGAAIDELLGLPAGAHEAWNAVDQAMAASAGAGGDDVTVRLAAGLWPRLDADPDQAWLDLLAAQHGVEVEALDYSADPAGSRRHINDWIADRTEGLITDLLPAPAVHPRTVLVLANALYFAAKWETPFGKYGPATAQFTRLDGTTVTTEFMVELELSDRRGTGDGFVGAELPYLGRDFSMLVIVPDAGRFAEVRDRLGQPLLDEIDAAWGSGPYELYVPKWETASDVDLIGWLGDRGIAPGAFPGIAPDALLDAAVHGADIAVDEEGTVAAAATALAFLDSGPAEPQLVVRADRPYLYLIRHRPTGLVLFAGQVTDPNA